jgi:murein DD-endopeptidase MepM/ murein hydrolase activator NlpD
MFGRTPQATIVSDWGGDVVAAKEQPAAPQAPAPAPVAPAPAAAAAPATNERPTDVPWGNPFGSARVVVTQGYGVGTHAPPERKGGIDLAVDADGDGRGNPEVTLGSPLYATMSGVIQLHPDSWPGGNHLWIKNEHYKVGYAHMLSYAVKNGQTVQQGDLIGYAGSTGKSTGPHLHYHIWKDGVNVNPLNYGAAP